MQVSNGSAPAVISNNIVVDGGTLYVAAGARFEWRNEFSNQRSMWLVNGGAVGYATGSTVSHGPVPHTLGLMVVCDTSSVTLQDVVLDGAVPAPFLLETATMLVIGSAGGLTEVTVNEGAALTLVGVSEVGVNCYFTLAADTVSAGPITPPPTGAEYSGTFAVGDAKLVSSASSVYVGGFWVSPGAVATFKDAPQLALFLRLAGDGNAFANLQPRTYPGSVHAAPACIDKLCTIRLGFEDSATIITNVYADSSPKASAP